MPPSTSSSAWAGGAGAPDHPLESAQSSRMRFHKRSGSRVTRFTGNDLEHNRSLLALPYPQLFTRVAVGQAGLAEHGMLIGDALGWCFVDLETGFQPAPLHRCELEQSAVWIIGHCVDPCFHDLVAPDQSGYQT